MTIIFIVVGIGLIALGMQIYFFLKSMQQAKSLTQLIPPSVDLKTVKVYLPDQNEGNLDSEKVLAEKHKHVVSPDDRISEDSFFDHVIRSENK